MYKTVNNTLHHRLAEVESKNPGDALRDVEAEYQRTRRLTA